MERLNIQEVETFVNENIGLFHRSKLTSLQQLSLKKDLIKKKNPYLFKAKNITTANEFVSSLLEAYLSSLEEKNFGDFLEKLAIFVASKTCGGRKSAATGIDLEFKHQTRLFLVSIKSGVNWGNSSQQNRQQQDFATAVRVVKQSDHSLDVQPVLGICYGRTRTTHLRGYLKVVGQNFWYLISGDQGLYKAIIEPLGYRAKAHNEIFIQEKGRLINLFTNEFIQEFCTNGAIDWERLVAFNSGNFDLHNYYIG